MIDLHVHTSASDGEFSPRQIIEIAYTKGIEAIAITDHDTVSGVREAIEAGKEFGIDVIPGIEISTELLGEEVHILGYYIDIESDSIENMVQQFKVMRDNRNDKLLKKFKDKGINLNKEDVIKHSKGSIMGKPHIAKALLELGYIDKYEEAFAKYLATKEFIEIKREMFSTEESIRIINEAGGIAVLAHPKYMNLTISEFKDVIIELKTYGLNGIECMYADNTLSETRESIEMAKKHGLLITGGTDFHGPTINKELTLGLGINDKLNVPYDLVVKMKEFLEFEMDI